MKYAYSYVEGLNEMGWMVSEIYDSKGLSDHAPTPIPHCQYVVT